MHEKAWHKLERAILEMSSRDSEQGEPHLGISPAFIREIDFLLYTEVMLLTNTLDVNYCCTGSNG